MQRFYAGTLKPATWTLTPTMTYNEPLPCPITGCKHSRNGKANPFNTITTLIRHLHSSDHKHSLHLIDNSICHEIKLFTCTHRTCTPHPGHFFNSQRALEEHNTSHHPPQYQYDHSTTTTATTFTDNIFTSHAHAHLDDLWTHGIQFILSKYEHDPPHFRSTWRHFLKGNNKKRFQLLHHKIMESIIQSNSTHSSAPFWWLLFHIELLILAPTKTDHRDNTSIGTTIHQRLDLLQSGDIEPLFTTAFAIRNRNTHKKPPHNNGNRAAQMAADSDNYRTAITRLNTSTPIAIIDDHNKATLQELYTNPVPTRTFPHHPQPIQTHHLLGDVCHTIKHAPKNKGTGLNADSIDIFTSLTKLNDNKINDTIRALFDIVYQGQVPNIAKKFFTDTYLFCLHKDTKDLSKLRPIGIPTAIRRIIASHIAITMKEKFGHHLLPYNYAVGVDGGMDFIIKAMQLSIEHNIINRQQENKLPTRAALFMDLTNMFNQVSREELFDIIQTDFPELIPITNLIYDTPASVHYKWKTHKWNIISMKEGVNQGCPLSSTFAALVLNRVLQPLDKLLKQRAQDRVRAGNLGDDGHGGITHLFAWVDDISATIPHEDIRFFLDNLHTLGKPRGCHINPQKSRILTSCNGTSILPKLSETNPSEAADIAYAINKYSTAKTATSTIGIELTDGFRLLGTPVGSPTFADSFFQEQLNTIFKLTNLNSQITDHQTRTKLFTTCILQKLPHLLSSDVMHHLPLDFKPENWPTYAGALGLGIHKLIDKFLQDLLQNPDIPDHSKCISHLHTNKGGLGLLFPRHRAGPDYVITMTSAIKRAKLGFITNPDITATILHPSITNLFDISINTESSCLQRYNILLPPIANIACSEKCPHHERTEHFQTKLSTHSMRSRIKQYCANSLLALTYETTFLTAPEHTNLLPSILAPQTSYPLIAMCRSNKTNRLPNWSFDIAIRRKLRLPIYDTTHPPICSCGKTHDPYGDHTFCCRKHSKKLAHNFIRDNWAINLQPAIALAGYIIPTAPLQTERPNLTPNNISARPFDFSFDPDPHPTNLNVCSCPYSIVGADITIAHSKSSPPIKLTADVQQKLTAAADTHLQEFERRKYMRDKSTVGEPNTTTHRTIPGEVIIKDLLDGNTILIPIAIDPHGYWGPITQSFLSTPKTVIPPLTFPHSRPNAKIMHQRATTYPSPTGILNTADAVWKNTKSRNFYGFSYTSPTPQIHTIQQLGLGITKAFTLHIRNSTKRDLKHNTTPVRHTSPTSTYCRNPP
jgi:hypothetical protein